MIYLGDKIVNARIAAEFDRCKYRNGPAKSRWDAEVE